MKTKIIFTSPAWDLSGVNTFSANLIRELRALDIPAQLLLTKDPRKNVGRYSMPLPTDIPIERLPVSRQDSWQHRWQVMINYLEEQAPCIYIPNYDWSYSCVSPKLSNRVMIVGIIHSDDPCHYEHVYRLGKYWNAIVAVSEGINQNVSQEQPKLSSRLVTIPSGIPVASKLPQRIFNASQPLKLIYTGRLVELQKRVFDLPKIMMALQERGVSVELTIVGDGAEANELQDKFQSFIERGNVRFLGTLPNEQVLELYEQHDVFLLTSDFEGMPVSLLEAMGKGCVPVVTDIVSGIPELVQNGVQGFRVPVGNIEQFADCITKLQQSVQLRQEMSRNAYRKISEGGYRTEDMVKRYVELFEKVVRDAKSGAFRRPRGRILIPAYLQVSLKNRLSASVRNIKNYVKCIFTT
jgi:glycosyltransferase involved in cell wall biosynthesis